MNIFYLQPSHKRNFSSHFLFLGVRFRNGFTLLELVMVIAIIAILTTIVLSSISGSREDTYLKRAESDFVSVFQSLEAYHEDYGQYPPDANRDVPPGLEAYLQNGTWPDAAWPGSVFDWDNWVDPATGDSIYQISMRFCPAGGPLSACRFPDEPWAANFGVNSAVYFCVQGACRAHLSELITYPGYCINC